MKLLGLIAALSLSSVLLTFCSKTGDAEDNGVQQETKLSYGDSIIYLKAQSTDYIVKPTWGKKGDYSSFPDGLEMDETTGAINVSESETGLRYRVTYQGPDGERASTVILLSGINYPDKYYRISLGDTLSLPIYNAGAQPLPSGSFDESYTATTSGVALNRDGKINLAQTVRNGFFGANPRNDDQKEIDITYRLNDKSGSSQQRISVILYYYKTMNDVPEYLREIISSRQGMVFRTNPTPPPAGSLSAARLSNLRDKPRPPCVIVIAQ